MKSDFEFIDFIGIEEIQDNALSFGFKVKALVGQYGNILVEYNLLEDRYDFFKEAVD